MIYVSTPALASASRLSTMQTQSELATIGQELSSGRLADAGLSLGSRAGTLVQVDGERSRLQARQTVNSQAATRLTATSSALGSLRATAQSMLAALTTASASGAGNAAGLKATAQGALGQLTATLDTAVGGDFIFGGINSGEKPVAAYAAGSASKAAVDTAFQAAFGTTDTASIDGAAMTSFLDGGFGALFDASGFGATWSKASDQAMTNEIAPNQTVDTSVSANDAALRQLAQAYTLISEFSGSGFGSGANSAAVAKATSLVTSALSGLTDLQAKVGLSQNAIGTANANLDSQISLLGSQSDDLDGIDAYALTTRLSSLQTQLQASYELTAKLHSMSLTQYLS